MPTAKKSRKSSTPKKAQKYQEDQTKRDREVIENAKKEYFDLLNNPRGTSDYLPHLRRAWLLLEDFLSSYPEYGIQNDEAYMQSQEKIKLLFYEWKATVKVSDEIEIYVNEENCWYVAKLLEQNATNGDYLIRYRGWGPRYDRWVHLDEELIQPINTLITVPIPKADSIIDISEEKEPSEEATTEPTSATEPLIAAEETIKSEPGNEVEGVPVTSTTTTTTTGRKVKRIVREGMVTDTPKEAKTKGKIMKSDTEEKDFNDWQCTVCDTIESSQADNPLVLCDGLCLRSFHEKCLDATIRPKNKEEKWYCPDCVNGEHLCFICGNKGFDYLQVYKCNHKHCGKFYHPQCIEKTDSSFIIPKIVLRNEIIQGEPAKQIITHHQALMKDKSLVKATQNQLKDRIEIKGEAKVLVKESHVFTCPRHYCDTCCEYYREFSTITVDPCIACPRAFHMNCIPPGSRFNNFCLLCPLHPERLLPGRLRDDLKAVIFQDSAASATANSNSNGDSNNDEKRQMLTRLKGGDDDEDEENQGPEDGRMVVLMGKEVAITSEVQEHRLQIIPVFYDQLHIPEEFPQVGDLDGNHYRLPYYLREELENTPLTFKQITRNNYDYIRQHCPEKYPAPIIPEYGCECRMSCEAKTCLNAMMHIECCEMKSLSKEGPICAVGKHCSNRKLQNREYVRSVIFQEHQMGLGLKAIDFVAKGTLVIEYVGEIIDETEMIRRLTEQTEKTPYDKDFYVMQLTNDGLYVDGKFQGNFSRFINHSCDPNCELQRWNVRGQTRIAIVAIRDILPDEPFSYDYQFETQQEEAFKCYCKTKKCRGTMAPNSSERLMKLAKSGRDEALRSKLIALGKSKEKDANSYKILKEEEWSRSWTSALIPGDNNHYLKNGPVKNTFSFGQKQGVFLVRNVMKSAERGFLRRCIPYLAKNHSYRQQLESLESSGNSSQEDQRAKNGSSRNTPSGLDANNNGGRKRKSRGGAVDEKDTLKTSSNSPVKVNSARGRSGRKAKVEATVPSSSDFVEEVSEEGR